MTLAASSSTSASDTTASAVLAAFWQGFVAPTRTALALMALMFLVTAAVVCAGFTPQLIAGPIGLYLPRSDRDAESFATREALSLSTPKVLADPTPRVYVISDSVLAQAFASDIETSKALQAATGKHWNATFLTTPLQGPLDEAALADQVAHGPKGVVVLPLSFERFGDTRDNLIATYQMQRLGLRSQWADQNVAALGGTPRRILGVYALDNGAFVLRSTGIMSARLALGRASTRQIDRYVTPSLTEAELAKRRGVILSRLHASQNPDDLGMKIMADTVSRLRASGQTVVFAEEPVSEALFAGPEDKVLYGAYLARSAETARALGGVYCRLAERGQIAPEAYPDYIHLIDPAHQAQLREALARCVARAYRPGVAS